MRKQSSAAAALKQNAAKKKPKKRKQYIPRSFLECQSLTHVVGFPPQNELVTTPVVTDFVKELFLDRFVKEIVKPFQPDKTTNKKNQGGSKSSTPTSTAENNAGYYHVMVGGKLVKKRRITSQDSNIQPNRTTATQPTEEIDERLARKRRIWKENIVIGTNQCLRLLENLNNATDNRKATMDACDEASNNFQNPSLIILTKDIYPPTMCCAVPVLTKRLGIPLLLLPGKASLELGRALNAKRTSILIFCCGDSKVSSEQDSHDKEILKARTAMASFVSFIQEQISQDAV